VLYWYYRDSDSSVWFDIAAFDSSTAAARWDHGQLKTIRFSDDRLLVATSAWGPTPLAQDATADGFQDDEGTTVQYWAEANTEFGERGPAVMAIDITSGAILWERTCNEFISANQSTVLMEHDFSVESVELASGSSLWQVPAQLQGDEALSLAVFDHIFTRYEDQVLQYEFWDNRQTIRWSDTLVAIGSGHLGNVLLVNRSSGAILWSRQFQAPLIALELSADRLVVATTHRVHAFAVPAT